MALQFSRAAQINIKGEYVSTLPTNAGTGVVTDHTAWRSSERRRSGSMAGTIHNKTCVTLRCALRAGRSDDGGNKSVAESLPPSCEVGEAPGFWRGLEWTLHTTVRCPKPLRQLVHVKPKACQSKEKGVSGLSTSLPTCVVRHMQLLEHLRNRSVLMMGDSTSAQLLMHSCDAFTSKVLPRTEAP
jgi:hypothetical protein